MDATKVKQKKIEYVFNLRTVLREIGSINRSPENLEAMNQIEAALNGTLLDESQSSLPGLDSPGGGSHGNVHRAAA